MATACFCGLPAFISVLMFDLTASFDLPFFSGTVTPSMKDQRHNPSAEDLEAVSSACLPLCPFCRKGCWEFLLSSERCTHCAARQLSTLLYLWQPGRNRRLLRAPANPLPFR